MRADKALRIVSSLADGHDPETGEVLPRGHVFQQPDVVRALGVAVTALQRYAKRQDREDRLPSRAGQPWTVEEDDRPLSGFDAGATLKELSDRHERTDGAIQSRLIRLGRLDGVSQPSQASSSET